MAHKGERYQQVPTLWHIGWGYECRVMRRRRIKVDGKWRYRWQNRAHAVLTLASAHRWNRLRDAGLAQIRRDVSLEAFIQAGIVPLPKRATWAGR